MKELGDSIQRANFTRGTILSDKTELLYVDTYHSLYTFLGIDVQASFNSYAGRGSGEVSFARSTKISQYNVYMLLRKKVETYHYRLVRPTLIDPAQELLGRSRPDFLKMYGDEFINAVTYGGVLCVLIEIVAQSGSETTVLHEAARGAAGPVSGSIDVKQKLSSVSTENRLHSRTFSLGVVGSVPIHRPEKETFYQYIDHLFEYFNTFNEHLKFDAHLKEKIGAELAYERVPYVVAEGRPSDTLDLHTQKDFYRDSLAVRDEITRREDVIEYAIANPTLYQTGDVKAFRQTKDQLGRAREQLERYVEKLFDNPAGVSSVPPTSIDKLPNLPTPVPVVDLPVQITLHTTDLRAELTASAAKGRMITFPQRKDIVLTFGKIDIHLVNYDLDVRVICQARIYISPGTMGNPPGRMETRQGINTIGDVWKDSLGILTCSSLCGLSFRLDGRDAFRYTVIYRALTYDLAELIRKGFTTLANLPPPQLTPYAANGAPLGKMDAVAPRFWLDIVDAPSFVGLELNLMPRA